MTDQNKIHKEQMKKRQAEQRVLIKSKKKSTHSLLLVNTGDGKGKSTAAFGTVIRALGCSWKVGIVLYVKGTWKTGEKEFFSRFPDLLDLHVMGDGFTWETQDREQDIASARKAWEVSLKMIQSGDYDLIVLDELNIVLRNETLPQDEILAGLAARHKRTHVIVTGRSASNALIKQADLVTEMVKIKHPFDSGIKAIQGLDF